MKLKIKLIMAISFCVLLCNQGITQTHSISLSAVKRGDKVPSYPLTNMLNYPAQSVKLTELNGKILILDFWNFTCTSCIASWPKLLKLQEKFNDQIQIVLINNEEPDTNKIKSFVQKKETIFGYKMNLPMANGDKQLKTLFPHYTLPHVIWIDKKGIVEYITGGRELNELIIQKMINGEVMKIATKTDERVEVEASKPLFLNGNGVGVDNGGNAIFSTIINPYTPDILHYDWFSTSKTRSYGYIANQTIKLMIRNLNGVWHEWAAKETPVPIPAAKTLIEMADSTKIVDDITGTLNNRYTIQLTVQKEIPINVLRKKMLADLELCFGIKSSIEKRKKKCLIISRNQSPITTYRNGEVSDLVTTTKLDINNITLQEFLNILGSRLASFNTNLAIYPIVDETKFSGKLGKITAEDINMDDLKAVGRLLARHGLDFSYQDRLIDVLVIRDNNPE